ncbi:2-methylcitrate dehydratase [Ralstonia sp. NFACC01]|jgi:2-methylcitrate dehydratase|uniref:2-methylcitrate dehydratase n=1 Tax=Ralstonia sp. NFACC01 TaxID=1566294 RepID=UPI0008F06FB0|nr:2-methylcitrate dehydratase [Ralstonia sp. NFACC01]SFO84427.1 2-methylcitrate dehydratase [Ralstonia sp. NFACC01]
MSAPVANTRTNPDKVIVDDVTLPGCAGRLGPTVSGTVEPTGTMAPGTALFAYQAIEGHQDTVARGARSTVLRMKNARVDDKPFTTNDHDAKKRPIAHGITARINGGKTFSGVVAKYQTGQKPGRSTRLSVCT